jgi:hypothetical protein
MSAGSGRDRGGLRCLGCRGGYAPARAADTVVDVTWAVDSLDSACRDLSAAAVNRLYGETGVGVGDADREVDTVRFPVAFVWLRGDRAGPGKDLSEQAIASYGYWNEETRGFFDIVFPGWLAEGSVVMFDLEAFRRCVRDVETISKWRYRDGVTEVLLVHFDYDVHGGSGRFSFSESVPMPVEQLVHEGKFANLDEFMGKMIDHARDAVAGSGKRGTVWEISSRIAIDRGRRSVWEWINENLLRGLGTIADEIRPFQVCNLSLPATDSRDAPAPA